MRDQSLNDRILKVLRIGGAMSASEIRRALPDDVESADLSSRLGKLVKRKDVAVLESPRKALTGPKTIKVYQFIGSPQSALALDENHSQEVNIFTLLPQS